MTFFCELQLELGEEAETVCWSFISLGLCDSLLHAHILCSPGARS